jgi:hypothetical protein
MGDQFCFKISIHISPEPGCILGWKILLLKIISGGVKGYALGTLIKILKNPFLFKNYCKFKNNIII